MQISEYMHSYLSLGFCKKQDSCIHVCVDLTETNKAP